MLVVSLLGRPIWGWFEVEYGDGYVARHVRPVGRVKTASLSMPLPNSCWQVRRWHLVTVCSKRIRICILDFVFALTSFVFDCSASNCQCNAPGPPSFVTTNSLVEKHGLTAKLTDAGTETASEDEPISKEGVSLEFQKYRVFPSIDNSLQSDIDGAGKERSVTVVE